MSITPKNWQTFQHYKDRAPAWIKLHKGLLTDYKFSCLPVASRALAPLLWLLASEYENGKITADFDEVAFRLHTTRGELCEALNPLIEAEFFTVDSEVLAARKQTSSLEIEEEREIEEEKKDTSLRSDWPSDHRERFWEEYPRKIGKAGALRELERVRKRNAVPWDRLLSAVRAYAATADPNFTKHPKTWLFNGCWDDEQAAQSPSDKTLTEEERRKLFAELHGQKNPGERTELRAVSPSPRQDEAARSENPGEQSPDDNPGSPRVVSLANVFHRIPGIRAGRHEAGSMGPKQGNDGS